MVVSEGESTNTGFQPLNLTPYFGDLGRNFQVTSCDVAIIWPALSHLMKNLFGENKNPCLNDLLLGGGFNPVEKY